MFSDVVSNVKVHFSLLYSFFACFVQVFRKECSSDPTLDVINDCVKNAKMQRNQAKKTPQTMKQSH